MHNASLAVTGQSTLVMATMVAFSLVPPPGDQLVAVVCHTKIARQSKLNALKCYKPAAAGVNGHTAQANLVYARK